MPDGDENSIQRLLGTLIEGAKSRNSALERIEGLLRDLSAEHTNTRIMVTEDRAWLRGLKWLVAVLIASVGALGFDWWRR